MIWSTVVGILQTTRSPSRSSTASREVRLRPRLLERRRPVRPDAHLGPGGRRGRRPVRLRQGQRATSRRPRIAGSAVHTPSTAPGLTCIPYPDDTADPSIGMPHLTFQIQDGQQKIISPEPYTTGKFQVPPGCSDPDRTPTRGDRARGARRHQAVRRAARRRRPVLLGGRGRGARDRRSERGREDDAVRHDHRAHDRQLRRDRARWPADPRHQDPPPLPRWGWPARSSNRRRRRR